MNNRVFITGWGTVTGAGMNCDELLQSLKKGETGIDKSVYFNNLSQNIKVASELKSDIDLSKYRYDDILHSIRNITRNKISLPVKSVISCAFEALETASVPECDMRKLNNKTGLIVGGSNLSQNTQRLLQERYRESIDFISPKYAIDFFDTNFVGLLSELFGIEYDSFTIGGASASGNVAVLQAYRMVKSGILDACLVVAPVADFSPYELQAFCNLGVFGNKFSDDPKKACRPFDKMHEGFILGQGAGALLIESEKSINNRNVRVLGEILGGSIRLDGNHLSDARVSGEQASMESALRDANVKAEQIDYVNAHGTSTPLGDIVEASALSNIFKNTEKKPFLNSSKSIIGHCLFSSGILELIITAMQMNNNFLHPNLNIEEPIDECKNVVLIGGETIYQSVNIAMSNSFGFGGINTSIIVKK